MHNIHTQGKTVPYAGGVKDIDLGGETQPQQRACARKTACKNPGRYSIKNPKRGIMKFIA
jgi:hypothetical protein